MKKYRVIFKILNKQGVSTMFCSKSCELKEAEYFASLLKTTKYLYVTDIEIVEN